MLKTDLILAPGEGKDALLRKITAALPIEPSEIEDIEIRRKALFLRDGQPAFKVTAAFALAPEREEYLLRFRKKCAAAEDLTWKQPRLRSSDDSPAPIVIGAGPCGLFAALMLAEAGARPLVIERGLPVEERLRSVDRFFCDRLLDPDSNIQFGEGGAGAFSDGKLKVGAPDRLNTKVLSTFVEAGAPEEILYTVGAHLGTDRLPGYVAAIRRRVIACGGRFLFGVRLADIVLRGGRLAAIVCERVSDGERLELPAREMILAVGHSARDTYEALYARGVAMQARGFGIGLRVEHPQEHIDRLVYGDGDLARSCGAASYHLVTHLSGGRSVYSFCMCPGGSVVAASSEPGGVVTNGMSRFARNGPNANAAHLVSVTPADFPDDSPLAGVALQRQIERAAFLAAGRDYTAPGFEMRRLMRGRMPQEGNAVRPTYPLGVVAADPALYLPRFVTESLVEGFCRFDDWMPGFLHPAAFLTGPETRSTSPVRILRSAAGCSSVEGIYPAGEGAGYAGGIVSSAVDGLRAADALLRRLGAE